MTEMEITDMDIVAALDSFIPTEDGMMESSLGPDVVSLASKSKEYQLTGRPSIPLYLSCDPDTFSEYQGEKMKWC